MISRAAREHVERCELVRDRQRMAVRRDQHGRREPHALGGRRERADGRDDVEHHRAGRGTRACPTRSRCAASRVASHADVVGEPERVIAEPVGELRELDDAHLLGLSRCRKKSRSSRLSRPCVDIVRPTSMRRAESILAHGIRLDARARARVGVSGRAEGAAGAAPPPPGRALSAASSLYRAKLASVGAEAARHPHARGPGAAAGGDEGGAEGGPASPSAVRHFAVADPAEFREVHPSTGTTGRPVDTIWSAGDVETITQVDDADALAVRRALRRCDPERVRVRAVGGRASPATTPVSGSAAWSSRPGRRHLLSARSSICARSRRPSCWRPRALPPHRGGAPGRGRRCRRAAAAPGLLRR